MMYNNRKIKFNRKNKKILLIILVCFICCLSVAYAALSVTLNITGNAEVVASNWNIYLDNAIVNDSSVTNDVPTISGTSLSFDTTLRIPGDFYEFTVDIVNDGSINAMIDSVVKTSDLSEDQTKYMNFTIEYENGATISSEQLLESGSYLTLKVKVEYRKDITVSDLPSTSSTVGLSFKVICVQSNAESFTDENGNMVIGIADGSTYVIALNDSFNAVPNMTLYDAISDYWNGKSGYGVGEYKIYDSDIDEIFVDDDGKRLNLKTTRIIQGETYKSTVWNVTENINDDDTLSGEHQTVFANVQSSFGYEEEYFVPIFAGFDDTYVNIAHAVFPNWFYFASATTIAELEQEIILDYAIGYPAGQSVGCVTITSHTFYAFTDFSGNLIKITDSINHLERVTVQSLSVSQDDATYEEAKEQVIEMINSYS